MMLGLTPSDALLPTKKRSVAVRSSVASTPPAVSFNGFHSTVTLRQLEVALLAPVGERAHDFVEVLLWVDAVQAA